ncbi:ARM repeat-containing protein [Suhomyces tanzawaensis NRRL Y-17324]|uniref:Sister chromatid cohesion protein n=1 Tax=Suhomyces tanzawaensis NRRL Y-17324 TaxID=984487 RepID=A0A1E4SB02_9ASCO|nr:ARM repeat-containing protein [Suhomyces tanzawaensis NRRL Y-17324]ODV76694.1 ARM repeat-containing protein [Suhomyces tanzawaensis NRRL Y-17324]
MTNQKRHPIDLREALSVTPLLHLIPKQDIAPLVSTNTILQQPDDSFIDAMLLNGPARQTRDAINQDPQRFNDVMTFLSNDFSAYNDDELEEIRFKLAKTTEDSTTTLYPDPSTHLPPFERNIFLSAQEIPSSFGVETTSSSRHEPKSRLSVRKDYESSTEATAKHNQRYLNKYRHELRLMGIIDGVVSVAPQESGANNHMKRALEDETNEHIESKRVQKQSYVTDGEITEKSFDYFCTVLANLLDAMQNTSDPDPHWVHYNGVQVPSINTLLVLYDCLYRIAKHPIVHQTKMEHIFKFQEVCLNALEEAKQRSWNEIQNLIKEDDVKFEQSIGLVQRFFEDCFTFNMISKIMMKILVGKWPEKRVYLDEYLQGVVDLTSQLVDDIIRPVCVLSSDSQQKLKVLRPMFSTLSNDLCAIFEMLTEYISQNVMEESLLTKLEYLSTVLIFLDGNRKEKLSVLGTNTLENLKIASLNLLVTVYKTSKDQREFILNEVLSNLEKLPTQKLIARQYKLLRGSNIQLVTALLVKFVEASAEPTLIAELLSEEYISEVNNHQKCLAVVKQSTQVVQGLLDISTEIASYLLNRLSKSTEQHSKQLLELLVEDLLILLSLPEWSSSENLLSSIMKVFLAAIQSQTCSALLENYLLEVLGVTAEKILHLRNLPGSHLTLTEHALETDIALIQNCMIDSLVSLQGKVSETASTSASRTFLVSKFIKMLQPLVESNGTDNPQLDSSGEEDVLQKKPMLLTLYQALISVFNGELIKRNNFDSEQSSTISYRSLLLSQELPELYENFLTTLLQCMESSKTKSKSRAVKILSSLVEVDPTLLMSPYIQDSISSRLLDSSPLVRDAVVDLVSKYLSSKPELIQGFHRAICDCMNDDSVQVRKRVIRLSKEMYINSHSKQVRVNIASKLLMRLADEDDAIQELAKSYLLDVWFVSLEKEKAVQNKPVASASAMKRGEVMVEIVTAGGKTVQSFENFLVDDVLSNNRDLIKGSLSLIVDSVLDSIIELEESTQDSSKDATEDSLNSNKEPKSKIVQIENSMKLISTFVKCESSLLSQDQLTSLQPFIIEDQSSGNKLCFYGLEILHYTLKGIDSLRPDFLDYVQPHLLRQLTKFNLKELQVAMPCVWKLSEMKNETAKLANATISCLKHIRPFIDDMKKLKNPKAKSEDFQLTDVPKLQKLLHLLGCFGKYCKLERHREVFLKTLLGLKAKESVVSLIIKFLLYFTYLATNPSIRNTAITNIINICSSHPKLFMSGAILKVIDQEFESNDLSTVHGIVYGLMEFLKTEENETYKKNGSSKKLSNESELDVAVFHGNAKSYVNDGICAGIVQRYIHRILKLCLEDSGHFSYLPIQFLQLVIKLGYANPKLCIPTIIALESTTNSVIGKIATDLHKELYDKHESLTGTSYVEGIKLAADYRKRVSQAYLEEIEFFESIYQIVRNSSLSRKKFVQSLCKVLVVSAQVEKKDDKVDLLSLIPYVSKNIAFVKFAILEEVLTLISCLDKQIATTGVDLMDLVDSKHVDQQSGESTKLFQAMITIIDLRQHLVSKYGVTPEQIDAFRPGKVDNELRQPLKAANHGSFELAVWYPTPSETEVVTIIEAFQKRMELL